VTESPFPTQPARSADDAVARLVAADAAAAEASHLVTEHAQRLLADGVPMATVCTALGISHHEWYRRVDALATWRQRHRPATG
jgi:hypothetical protein